MNGLATTREVHARQLTNKALDDLSRRLAAIRRQRLVLCQPCDDEVTCWTPLAGELTARLFVLAVEETSARLAYAARMADENPPCGRCHHRHGAEWSDCPPECDCPRWVTR